MFEVNHLVVVQLTKVQGHDRVFTTTGALQVLQQQDSWGLLSPDSWTPSVDTFLRATQSVFENPIVTVSTVDVGQTNWDQLELHFEFPAIEVTSSAFSALRVTLTCITYYGVKLASLPRDYPPKAYFPETWDPQQFVEGRVIHSQINFHAGVFIVEFPLDNLVIAPGAQFWMDMLVPYENNQLSPQAVAYFAYDVRLQDRKFIGKRYIPAPPGDELEDFVIPSTADCVAL